MHNRLKAVVHELFDSGIRYEDARQELERLYFERAMEVCDGCLTRAAAQLGVHRNTVTRKLADHRRAARKYGLMS